jgi:hypothetical protein
MIRIDCHVRTDFRGMCFASGELVQCSLDSSNSFGIVICETDCQVLVRLWKARLHRAVVSHILSEISDLCIYFCSVEICFANSVAHEYARYACTNRYTAFLADCNSGVLNG